MEINKQWKIGEKRMNELRFRNKKSEKKDGSGGKERIKGKRSSDGGQ
jgi:hypothetical protein